MNELDINFIINKDYTIGLGYFITKLEKILIRYIIIGYGISKDIFFYLVDQFIIFLKIRFNIKNRRKSIIYILTIITLIKLYSIMKYFLCKRIDIKKDIKFNEIKEEKNNLINYNTNSINCFNANVESKEKKKKQKYIKDNDYYEKSIKLCLDKQNKILVKNNLKKENTKTAFYSIMKYYINENIQQKNKNKNKKIDKI